MTTFGLQSTISEGRVSVVVTGDLDMAAAFKLEPELDRLVAAPDVRALELDLAEIGFIDSTGLGALIAVRDHAAQRGIEFAIARASPNVERILDLTGTRGTVGAR